MSWILPPAVALLASCVVDAVIDVQFAPSVTLKAFVEIELSPLPSTWISFAAFTSWKVLAVVPPP